MASILDEYEDLQNTRQRVQQHSRLTTANIGITHSGKTGSPSVLLRSATRSNAYFDHVCVLLQLTRDCVLALGFVNVRLEEEKPIFNKQRIDFTPPEKINHLAVCNNQLCMSLGKDSLLRQATLS